ncbi:MAG: protein translocase subunit SecD [bacterium]|nr:protein translocase subunit SecD [bacterium]MCP4798578.1 protein translocase subunit SecD [bacterium]
MKQTLRVRAAIIIAVVLVSLWWLYPTWQVTQITDEMRIEAKDNPELLAEIEKIESGKIIRKGLDLEGGMYIVLEIDDQGMTTAQAKDALDRVVEILRNRIDQFGVSEPDIKPMGTTRIIVQLPGMQDVERAKNLIGTTARLEFKLVRPLEDYQTVLEKLDKAFKATATLDEAEEVVVEEVAEVVEDETAMEGLEALPSDDQELFDEEFIADHPFMSKLLFNEQFATYFGTPVFVTDDNLAAVTAMLESPEAGAIPKSMELSFNTEPVDLGEGMVGYPLYLLNKHGSLTGDNLTNAVSRSDTDKPGQFMVSMSLNRKGARLFSKATGENVGRNLAITLDGKVNSAPRINERIGGGQASITGGFSAQEAQDLALLLRAGALPVDVRIEEERTVGPSLGQDSVTQGMTAALYGLIAVIIFIVIYYRGSGLIVVLALVTNLVILMGVLAQFGLVLTLPGIAGIILTIGMAVDANVLINERIREELRRNKTARAAVDSGYANATRTIVDANVTTLIAAGILLWFGAGPIKGFAVTLSIGILTSMFTSLVLTRVIMELVTKNRARSGLSI